MAPPRVDKKKFSKEKSKKKTDKTDSKSSLPSTTIADLTPLFHSSVNDLASLFG